MCHRVRTRRTEAMLFLSSMLQTILLGNRRRTLEAQIVGRERDDRPTIAIDRCLGYNRVSVEDAPQYHLIMLDAAVHDLLTLCQKTLDMLYITNQSSVLEISILICSVCDVVHDEFPRVSWGWGLAGEAYHIQTSECRGSETSPGRSWETPAL